jgi:excisionase family DNA binding protein
MPLHVDVEEAARHLSITPSRIRELISGGGLRADKVGGRWLVEWESVLARERSQAAPGRPLSAGNSWALLLLASGDHLPSTFDPHARWRMNQTLDRNDLAELQSRLDRRALVHRLWAIPGELRPLRAAAGIVLTGSSAAGELEIDLLAPDAIDAYVPSDRVDALRLEHGLEQASARDANVTLRAVPEDAWLLDEHRVAPRAAVGLDLIGYPDSRSARVGNEVLAELDASRRPGR